jgi:hypothetical protein
MLSSKNNSEIFGTDDFLLAIPVYPDCFSKLDSFKSGIFYMGQPVY